MEKKISVIIPCYNVEKQIDRCLQSIVSNSMGIENLKIICVDDASTDGTLEKLIKWEKRFSDNFIIVPCEVNGRQGCARNIGLNYADTKYVAFIDSDDWIEKDYFEYLLTTAEIGDYQVVQCGYMRDPSEKLVYINHNSLQGDLEEEVIIIDTDEKLRENIVYPKLKYLGWGKLIQRDFLVDNAIYFLEGLAYEDNYWGSLLNICVEKACSIPNTLYHYYVNDNSTVLKKNEQYHIDYLTVQEALWDEYSRRGLLDKYGEELVTEHIYTAFLQGMKVCILRFDEPNYHMYRLLRQMVISHVGDYQNVKYIRQGLGEKYDLMLMALEYELGKSDFEKYAETVKRLGL